MMERWRQIESLFQEALQYDPAERHAWLREAYHSDAGLQGEVASLLAITMMPLILSLGSQLRRN